MELSWPDDCWNVSVSESQRQLYLVWPVEGKSSRPCQRTAHQCSTAIYLTVNVHCSVGPWELIWDRYGHTHTHWVIQSLLIRGTLSRHANTDTKHTHTQRNPHTDKRRITHRHIEMYTLGWSKDPANGGYTTILPQAAHTPPQNWKLKARLWVIMGKVGDQALDVKSLTV